MRAAGIAVAMQSSGRPTVRLVVADDSSGSPVIDVIADFPSDDAEISEQLHDAAEAVRSRLDGTGVTRVVVRRADRPQRPSNAEGPKLRLLMEGAIVSAARSVIVDTRLGSGKDVGGWCGSNKAAAEAAAAALLTAAGHKDRYIEATAAALAALAL